MRNPSAWRRKMELRRQHAAAEAGGGADRWERPRLRRIPVDSCARRSVMQNTSASVSMEDPPQTKPCLKRFAQKPTSNESFDPRVPHDMKRRRRVKFAERDVFSLPTDPSDGSGGDGPKTSEYKSFKRLLEEAGRGSHSREMVREGNVLSSSHRGAMRNKPTRNKEATGSVLSVEKVSPIKQFPSVSTIGTLDDREPQYKNGGTFYEKRQNLIKSAASVLSLDVNELFSKSCDLIAEFLHRLRINGKTDNCNKLCKRSTRDSDGRSRLLACRNMRNFLEEPYETLETKHKPTVVRYITENNFPGGRWNRADSMEHVEAQLYPVWDMTESHLPKTRRRSYFLLDSPYLPAKNNSDLDFNPTTEGASSRWRRPMLDNKIPTSSQVNHELSRGVYEEQPIPYSNFHFLELDILRSPIKTEQFSRQHSSLPLLEWNEERNNEEEVFVDSDSMEMEGLYHLPLTVYRVPQSLGPVGGIGVIGSYAQGNFLHSFGDIRISKDMIYPSLDQALLPSRTEFTVGPEWDLPTDHRREIFLSCDNHRQLSCISSNPVQRYLVEPKDTKTSMVFDLYDLPSPGFGVSPELKKMFFLSATDE